eukprot:9940641-Alexandrium_andersonii.AAC.1
MPSPCRQDGRLCPLRRARRGASCSAWSDLSAPASSCGRRRRRRRWPSWPRLPRPLPLSP